MSLKIIFMGTPDFSVPTLRNLIQAGHEICAVFCQPPRPAGRGKKDRKSPVHLVAEGAGISVFCPKSLRNEKRQREFQALGADIAIVVAYGLILPKPILEAPPMGCLNLHGSLLPRWRGAAPIQRAIMAGDHESGINVMRMDEGLDTGPVCLEERMMLGPDMTAGELHDDLSERGAKLMSSAVDLLEKDELTCEPQPETGITYAAKIEKSEAHIDFTKTAIEVHNQIRGLSPFPGAWFKAERNGQTERIKILKSCLIDAEGTAGAILDDQMTIACGEGAIRPVLLQRAGKKPMDLASFTRGFEILKGVSLI